MTRPVKNHRYADLKPRLLNALEQAQGSWVSATALIQSVYYDHDLDEPEYANCTISKLVRSLRRDGWNIPASHGPNGGYRLIAERMVA